MTRFRPWTLTLSVLTICASVVAAWFVMRIGGTARAAAQAEAALELARHYQATSWLSIIVLELLASMAGLIPASLVGIAAGAVLGVGQGFAVSSACLLVGALAAFGLSRSLLRPLVARLLAKRTSARYLDAAVGHEGWKLVLLLRVSPLTPFAATSYVLGVSAVTVAEYALGTLAALPALFAYVALGALAEQGLEEAAVAAGPLQLGLLSVGFATTALIVVHIGTLVARAARLGESRAAKHRRDGADTPSTVSGKRYGC